MSNLVEKLDTLERVGELKLKGWKPTEIARHLGISTHAAKHYIEQHKELLRKRVEEDPEFLERIADNTIEALDRLDTLIKEAWDTYDTAKNEGMINQQINLLKVAGSLEAQRANLLQLMGAKMDSGMMQRMHEAEQVNSIVSGVIKDIVSKCEHCKLEAQIRLAEAFQIMKRPEEAAEMRPSTKSPDFIDMEEDDHDQHAMMADVVDEDR